MGVTKIGRANANYWIEAVAEGGDDYYTKPGEAPGEWMGELTAELGLSGEVDRDAYAAVLAGKHPVTGAVLVSRPEPRKFIDAEGRERRLDPILGYDIRFAAPKSVSLLYAVGSPEVRAAVLRAHDHAVAEAVGYLERTACFVQRGKGGVVIEPGGGFLSMAFRHRSSRAGDPALHTHLVTANMTRALSDGRWLSLANPRRQSPLLREAKAAGHVYQAALRAELTRDIGAEWQQVVNGYADLAGIGRPVIDHFSQRRAEIVAAMAERGTTSAAAAEVAAYRTRDAKEYAVDPDTQRQEWATRAAEFDLTSESIDRMLARGRRREPQAIGAQHLDRALADLEAHHSHFDRRDLLSALANQLREGADARALEAAVRSLVDGDRLIEIHRGAGPLDATYYTTPRLWELEQRFMATARKGENAGAAVVDGATLSAVLDRHRYLSDQQVEMVRRLTTGGERIVTVAALPGTGKTTALAAAQEAWAAAGIRGVGVATARSASGELSDAGVPATSVTAFLIQTGELAERGIAPLPRGTVIVVDESSTTPTPHMTALADLAEGCDGKLVLIGDPRQIGAVGPGGLYGNLTNEIEPVVLTQIRRQRDPVDRRIVELAHEGRGSDALDVLRAHDRLVIADTLPEVFDAQVLDWHKQYATDEDAVMIARRTRDVADLNELAREFLAAEGRLGKEALVVGGQPFAVGDRIITRINTPEVSNRERWEIVGVDQAKHHLYLQRLGAEGDGVRLDRRYLEKVTPSREPAIQHAYALTTYSTESKTFDSAFALLDSGISREDFTVAISRTSGATTAYGVAASELTDADLGPGTREVEDAAHDLRVGAERAAGEYAAVEVGSRKRIEAMAPLDLASRRAELERRLTVAAEPSPAQERLAGLEERIAAAQSRLGGMDDESARQLAAKQLHRLEGERDGLKVEVATETPRGSQLTGTERAEMALIEDRLVDLRRRAVAAERSQPSKMIVESLGPRPKDPLRASMWNNGVDAIYGYRQRYGITTSGKDPLGGKPRDAAQRRDHREAQLRIARVQKQLGKQRARSATRAMRIGR
ncbi:MAG TPA: MobF family relaxase [Solirubrobacterales bacterium]|nr:MobF family relaxase [Solirubrobacterales bacterium]